MSNSLTKTLYEICQQLHVESYALSKTILGKYFQNAGNIGIFCQNELEFEEFNLVKGQLTYATTNENLKYFELIKPIVIDPIMDIPTTTYTHLYIRKPDTTPYGKFRGDIDFYTSQDELEEIVMKVTSGKLEGAEIYHQKGVGDLVQIHKEGISTVAYLSTKRMTIDIRVKH